LAYLQEKYPSHSFALIMGEDNLNSLHKWKNYEVILENHDIYVYPRVFEKTEDSAFNNHPQVHFIDAPVIEISSTFIRESISSGKNVRPLLPAEVFDFIDLNNIYKK
jgi:nicotinate-nucleotide adenylyltransferase